MLQSSSKPYENHHLILDHLDSHLSQDIEDHIPQFYRKATPISSTSSPEPPQMHVYHQQQQQQQFYRPNIQQQQQQFRVIKDGRQMYEESGYQVTSSGSHHAMDTKAIEMAPPVNAQKVKIISSEEPTSSMPDLGEFLTENFQTKSIKFLSFCCVQFSPIYFCCCWEIVCGLLKMGKFYFLGGRIFFFKIILDVKISKINFWFQLCRSKFCLKSKKLLLIFKSISPITHSPMSAFSLTHSLSLASLRRWRRKKFNQVQMQSTKW